ncbi:MAG: DUF2269 family protein [Archangium sp.]|nr:DUF2269 family protein [Archangium sp.]
MLWLRLLHLLGAFGFIAAHGATVAATFKLRTERDPVRVGAMLELSRATRGLMYGSFLLLVGAGIATATLGGWWHSGWLWTSIGLLTLLFVAAFPLAVPYFRAIRAELAKAPVDQAKLDALLSSPRGLWLAWIETVGLLLIIYLMVLKPF